MALKYARVGYEHREIVLRNKPKKMLDISPKGTVPVFVLDDGTVLDESLDIARWALSQNDPDDWMGVWDEAIIQQNDGAFKVHLDRYRYPNRYPDEDPDEHRVAAEGILESLEKWLSSRTLGSTNATDILIFPFIRQYSKIDPKRWNELQLPNLKAWLDEHLQSQLFADVMEKKPLWSKTDR